MNSGITTTMAMLIIATCIFLNIYSNTAHTEAILEAMAQLSADPCVCMCGSPKP